MGDWVCESGCGGAVDDQFPGFGHIEVQMVVPENELWYYVVVQLRLYCINI